VSPDSTAENLPEVQTVELSANPSSAAGEPLAPGSSVSGRNNFGLLLDVEVEASLRFGERELQLREILDLHAGSVVELNRQLQEPVELLVAGRVIAHGEVVVVDGNYGLRITDIVQSPQRLEPLPS
jgi:flagellar motor switch protein FliN/FliY